MKHLILFFLITFSLGLAAQQQDVAPQGNSRAMADQLLNNGWADSSRHYMEGVIDAYEQKGDTLNEDYALSCLWQSQFYYNSRNLNAALEYAQKGLPIAIRLQVSPLEIARGYFTIGTYFTYAAENPPKAKEAFLTCISLLPNTEKANYLRVRSYGRLGKIHRRLGDFSQAESYYKQGLNIRENAPDKSALFGIGLRSGLSAVYAPYGLNQPEKEKVLLLDVVNDPQASYDSKVGAYQRLGEFYLELGQFEKSSQSVRASLQILLENGLDSTNHFFIQGLVHLGNIAKEANQLPLAHTYYAKAIHLAKRHPNFLPMRIGVYLYHKSETFEYQGLDSLALATHQEALSFFATSFSYKTIFEVPFFDQQSNEPWIASILRKKAQLFLDSYAKRPDPAYLQATLTHADACISRLEKLALEIIHQKDDFQSVEIDYDIFQYGLEACRLLYDQYQDPTYLHKAFQYMEQGKALLLQQHTAIRSLMKADTLMQKVDSLNQYIIQERIRFAQQKNENTDSLELLVHQLEVERDFLKQNYPENRILFSQLEQMDGRLILANIQENLTSFPSQGLIHYFLQDTQLYFMVIVADQINFWEESVPPNFAERLQNFRKALQQVPPSQEAKQAFQSYQQEAYALYQLLLKPACQRFQGISDWVILPHQHLNLIPFEALLDTAPDPKHSSYQDLPYCLHTYNFSYAFSGNAFLQSFDHKRRPSVLAIAPTFGGTGERMIQGRGDTVRGDLQALTWASREAEQVYELFGGELLIGMAATETNFKKAFSKKTIIHIASHAMINEERPELSRIYFHAPIDTLDDGALFLAEIQAMDFPNRLIYLSACNSGWGKLSKGDGLMSLARAFSYAGCPNLVASLWQANDRSSYEVSTNFFKGISEGQALSQAMKASKEAYLLKADPLKSHPYYWAHLRVIGNPAPIYTGGNWFSWPIALIALLIFLAAGGYFFLLLRNRPQ